MLGAAPAPTRRSAVPREGANRWWTSDPEPVHTSWHLVAPPACSSPDLGTWRAVIPSPRRGGVHSAGVPAKSRPGGHALGQSLASWGRYEHLAIQEEERQPSACPAAHCLPCGLRQPRPEEAELCLV